MSAKTFKENAMETWVYTEPVETAEEHMLAEAAFSLDAPIRSPIPAFPLESCNAASLSEPSDFLLGC
jgi:hypothetical protein